MQLSFTNFPLGQCKTEIAESDMIRDYYQQMIMEIQGNLRNRYPLAFYMDSNNQMAMKNIQALEMDSQKRLSNSLKEGVGRGGNNVAQNIKKSIMATLKHRLSPKNYEYFLQAYMRKHSIKSQKENYILFFMFLHLMCEDHLINKLEYDQMANEIRSNIKKYIRHSLAKSQIQRPEFHKKNAHQFQKFLKIDIDFSKKKRFDEISMEIQNLFLRKKVAADEAIERVLKIIHEYNQLKNIFDFGDQNDCLKVEEEDEVFVNYLL